MERDAALAALLVTPKPASLPIVESAWSPRSQIDEYQLDRRLGAGGMGEVWLARDTLLERDVAIKFAFEEGSDAGRLRFRVEARAIARLHHPNIVVVHHAGELDERPFLVTELLQGKALDSLGQVPPDRVIAIGVDLTRGLAAAHAAGVLHRDIKPANAFLCEDGVGKLLDFGLAQLREDQTVAGPVEAISDATVSSGAPGELESTVAGASVAGQRAGTPLYMAPETWLGQPATGATDVYSMGGLLFTLLANRPPYSGSAMAVCAAVVNGDPPDLAGAAPGTPPALVDLVLRCLRRRPEDRPSAEALCNELQAMLASRGDQDAGEGDPGGNPYRGLLTFGAEHRGLFFGRDAETAAALTELAGSPFVLVVGASGAGKSSLVRAGVVPRVLAGALGRGAWRVATMVPGSRPLERLAQALSPFVEAAEEEVLAGVESFPSWAAQRIEQRRAAGRRVCVLLVVDQFEEAWTLSSAADRAMFFEALTALTQVGPSVRLVATVRVDFLGQLGDLGELGALVLRAPVMLGPLSSEGLRQAIEEPARRRGVTIEPALVDALVERARGTAAMLPFLEFALGVMWERRNVAAKRMTLKDLDALGGLEGALSAHADAALGRLAPRLRAEAKRILLELVTVERTRARREARDLLGTAQDARVALDALVEARLVIASAGEETTAYEIAHEVLVSGWPTLRKWLDEEAAARELQERLRRAAAEWERLAQGTELLWGARQLQALEVPGAIDGTGELERRFVEASRMALRRERRLRLGAVLGVPLMLAIAGGGLWGVSFARHRAAVARAVAVARALNDAATESVPAAEAARREAFALFEENDIQPAEARWKQALALEENTDRLRGNVWKALDQAVALDPRDAAARALYADVILQRLLAAERLHQTTLVGPLRAQLGIYDDGSRASALLAPGHVRFEIEPPEATMSLARYREDGAGRLVEGDVAPIVGGASRELEPGSYILVAAAPGRYSTRYPFLVRRGEKSALRIVLPRAEDVPAGMIYVPAGRTLYGSGDDEPTRGFLTHQPMHDIDVAAFLMARTEVTNAQYLAFLHALPDDVAKQRLPLGLKRLGDGRIAWTYRDRVLNPGEPYCSGVQPCVDWSLLPVLGTSWEDGEQFAAWLWRSGQLPGARLCTDREWERGARGADDRRFPSGDGDLLPTDACTLATYGGDTTRAGPCAAGTHPASRSPFGVDDLAGSMLEWTAGPADVANPAETTVRSGSFLYSGLNQTIPNRSVALSGRESDYGLRICAGAK